MIECHRQLKICSRELFVFLGPAAVLDTLCDEVSEALKTVLPSVIGLLLARWSLLSETRREGSTGMHWTLMIS